MFAKEENILIIYSQKSLFTKYFTFLFSSVCFNIFFFAENKLKFSFFYNSIMHMNFKQFLSIFFSFLGLFLRGRGCREGKFDGKVLNLSSFSIPFINFWKLCVVCASHVHPCFSECCYYAPQWFLYNSTLFPFACKQEGSNPSNLENRFTKPLLD